MSNTEHYSHLSHSSFKIVLCTTYTLLPATTSVFETFQEAILWKPFQLFRRILNYFSSITKRGPFSVEGTDKNQLEPCKESMGNAPVL